MNDNLDIVNLQVSACLLLKKLIHFYAACVIYAGASAGKGTYFAPNLSTSLNIARACSRSQIHVMLVRVITGIICQGYNMMDWTEVQKQKCHCTVNYLPNPSEYVTYHDAAAYPEYILKIKINSKNR